MVSDAIKLEKNLLCQEDVQFGRGGVKQFRNGVPVNLSKIPSMISVENFSELKNIDPRKFDVVALISKEPLIAPINKAHEPKLNEFYKFDFTSNAAEDLPLILASNVLPTGRWVLTRMGGAILQEFVDKAVDSLKDDILDKVKESLDEKVSEATNAALLELKKQGGLYQDDIEYSKGDLCRIVVRSNNLYNIRNFLVKAETLTNTPPVTGNSVMVGNLKVYENEGLIVNNTSYTEIKPSSADSVVFTQDWGKTYLYLPKTALDGTLSVKFRDHQGLVTASMDIIFNGSSYSDFMIRNVMYSKAVRADNFMKTEAIGKVFYPGFALHISPEGVGFSIWDNRFSRVVELNYTKLNVVPELLSEQPISTSSCYALREGGGSYIQGICNIIPDVRPNSVQSGDSIEFHLFMIGCIHWNTSMRLDQNIYHQFYAAGGVDLSADPSEACLSNTLNGGNAGGVYRGQLPDLEGSIGLLQNRSSGIIYTMFDTSVKGDDSSWERWAWEGFYPKFESSLATMGLDYASYIASAGTSGDKYNFFPKIKLRLSGMRSFRPDGYNPFRNGRKIIPESVLTRFLIRVF